MNLKNVLAQSIVSGKPFRRPNWHYVLWYEEMLGHYTDGYNGMSCSHISIEDAVAEDFELVTFCKDCGAATKSGSGSARCPSCWDDKCGYSTDEE